MNVTRWDSARNLFMLILALLERNERLHASEISRAIQVLSGGVLRVRDASLFPSLQQMLTRGWVKAESGLTAENRGARYCRPTKSGRRQLEKELLRFERAIGAIAKIIHANSFNPLSDGSLRNQTLEKLEKTDGR